MKKRTEWVAVLKRHRRRPATRRIRILTGTRAKAEGIARNVCFHDQDGWLFDRVFKARKGNQ